MQVLDTFSNKFGIVGLTSDWIHLANAARFMHAYLRSPTLFAKKWNYACAQNFVGDLAQVDRGTIKNLLRPLMQTKPGGRAKSTASLPVSRLAGTPLTRATKMPRARNAETMRRRPYTPSWRRTVCNSGGHLQDL